VLCTTILIVAYSPLQWISPGIIANPGGGFGQKLPLSLAAALVTSGIQITSMMSVRTKPSLLELSLFCTLHIVAFLAAYLVMGAMETVSQLGVHSLVCVLFAIVAPCCCFVYTRGKAISGAG